jgi:3'-phosphoadenosine 5'-phosphosulfate sulfotransferase (PAPS reductase)/FAD synthetase
MKRFIAFSGGVESTTMCLLYGKGATAIFADTGSEHSAMYKRIDLVEAKLKEMHGSDFSIIRIKPQVKVKGEIVETLTEYIEQSRFFPSASDRFCTGKFKIDPIDKYLKLQGECELMIGLNADETDREGNHGLVSTVLYSYPLIDAGLSRADCVELLELNGLKPDFPAYMRRGGCVFCPFKSKKEYKAMVHLSLPEISMVAELEKKIQDTRGKFYRIKREMTSMADFIEYEKNNLFGDLSPYYDASEDQYSCGVFCHR